MRGQDLSFAAPGQPIDVVLFDLHSTLVDQGSATTWLELADPEGRFKSARTAELATFLERIWENARQFDPHSSRDLDPVAHYEVFHALMEHGPGIDRIFADRLYETMLDPWHAYDDTIPTLRALRDMDVHVVVLSNIGVEIDHVLERTGIAEHIDGRVLSLEVGHVKPGPEIFRAALAVTGLPASRTLMVGDSPKDDVGAAHIGIRTLLLPRTSGPIHGLDLVRGMVSASRTY
jgi:HAD superfamily hydrolase (TIGR01509 family)